MRTRRRRPSSEVIRPAGAAEELEGAAQIGRVTIRPVLPAQILHTRAVVAVQPVRRLLQRSRSLCGTDERKFSFSFFFFSFSGVTEGFGC